ncbi:MAG TPA: hypothetical protein VFX50_03135 [Gemmatimonadales bacterium]|nr:hypothetical protein [Gemmatimonadales bacterium]
MPSLVRAAVLAACATLGACLPRDPAPEVPPADLRVTVAAGALVAPDTVAAGWTRLRVDEDGAGHIVVLFRLPDTATEAETAAFLAALDTARVTPAPGLALGGPEVGDTGTVVLELSRGSYVLGCLRRGADGHRHAVTGEARTLVVGLGSPGSEPAAPPVVAHEVRMTDFAYAGSDTWEAGAQLLRVVNDGRQDHQLRIDRLQEGVTLQDWLRAEDASGLGTPVAGVARLGPGPTAYLPLELVPATYVLYCLVTDPSTGRQHVELGMLRAVAVR